MAEFKITVTDPELLAAITAAKGPLQMTDEEYLQMQIDSLAVGWAQQFAPSVLAAYAALETAKKAIEEKVFVPVSPFSKKGARVPPEIVLESPPIMAEEVIQDVPPLKLPGAGA